MPVKKIKLPDSSVIDINDSRIHIYRTLTGTAADTVSPYSHTKWDATDSTITEYVDGMVVCLKVPVAGNGTYGTGLQINDLGYKPVVYNVNSMISTRYSVGSIIWCVYNATQTGSLYINSTSAVTVTGCWQVQDYDTNTNTIGYQLRTNSSTRPVSSATYRYRLMFSSLDNSKWVPANNSTSTNATSSRTVNQEVINPWGRIVYYSTTTARTAGQSLSATAQWDRYIFNLGYSFNNGSALDLTFPGPVYIKCTPQAGGGAIIDSTTPYTQSLPSAADDKIYIYLGQAYSESEVELIDYHPVLYHDGSKIVMWTGAVAESDVFVCTFNTTNNTMDKTFQEIADARNAGKVVICILSNEVYYLSTLSETSNTICFVHITSSMTPSVLKYLKFANNSWTSYIINIQDSLVSGTNIKTINGNSLLGSGNITIDSDIFPCTFTLTSGITGTIDKTASEILQAANANKSVLCIYGNEIYFLVSKNVLTFSRIIGNVCKYISYNQPADNWTIITTNLQTSLVSGTNIKTINNESLLGSGNITIQGGSSTLSALTDTTITTPSDGQVLTYDNATSKWVNGDMPTEVLKCNLNISLNDPGDYSSGLLYTCDKTDAEIYAAYQAGKCVILETTGSDFSFDIENAPETHCIYYLNYANVSQVENTDVYQFFFSQETNPLIDIFDIAGQLSLLGRTLIVQKHIIRVSGNITVFGSFQISAGWYYRNSTFTTPANTTSGHLASLTSSGEYSDSGIASTDVSTAITNSHTHSNKTYLDKIPSSNGTNGQVLTSDGSSWSWQTPSSGLTDHDFTHTSNTTISGSTTTVTFAANTRGTAMLTISADLGLTIACNNGSDNYIWVKNTGSSEVDVTISGVTKNSTNVSNVYMPSDGISVPAGGLCEIGVIVNTDGAFITSRNDLAL